jgi:glycerol-3-phosphate dehydrogenase (NAD(P)+)
LGCGRWGSFLTWYLQGLGHEVTLYGRADSARMQALMATRTNGQVTLPASVTLCCDLERAIKHAQTLVISVGAQNLRELMRQLAGLHPTCQDAVLCMKGLEIGTGARLSQIAAEYLPPGCGVAVWLGPGHVQEFTAGIPNCMVIDSQSEAVKDRLINAFKGGLIRFYYGQDLLGNEMGGAAKNVIGIAAGMLDGMGLSNLKGALMSRGTREIARLICAMGGSEQSAYGLCHLGDYQATVFSPFSHNRSFGEHVVSGEPFTALAEGCYTVKAMLALEARYEVELPICNAIHAVLYQDADARTELDALFTRSLKREF